MPIQDRWWMFTDGVVDYDRNEAGVYELGDASSNVVYIGGSNELRRRLKEHLLDSQVKQAATQYRIEYTPSYMQRERQLIDEFLRTYGRLPRYNVNRP